MGLHVLISVCRKPGAALWLGLGLSVSQPAIGLTQWAEAPDLSAAESTSGTRTFSSDMEELWDAFTYTLSAPGRWDSGEWVAAGLVTGGVVASTAVDRSLRGTIRSHRGAVGDALERVGFWYGTPLVTVPASLLTYGAGAAFGADGVRDTGLMMMDVLLLVGLVQQPARVIAGRARPELGVGNLDFKPLSLSNERASFPSGHAWIAFGISNILARQIDRGWAYAAFFGLAGISGWSRLYADKHWLSDVLLGGILGYLTSTTVWHWFEEQRLGADMRAVSPGRWVTLSFRF